MTREFDTFCHTHATCLFIKCQCSRGVFWCFFPARSYLNSQLTAVTKMPSTFVEEVCWSLWKHTEMTLLFANSVSSRACLVMSFFTHMLLFLCSFFLLLEDL